MMLITIYVGELNNNYENQLKSLLYLPYTEDKSAIFHLIFNSLQKSEQISMDDYEFKSKSTKNLV